MAKVKKASTAPTLNKRLALLLKLDDIVKKQEIQLNIAKKNYAEAERTMLEALQTQGVTAAKNSEARVEIKPRVVVGIEDFNAFIAYVFEHGASDLLHRRVAQTAVLDREDQGETIPGLKKTKLIGLNLTRVKPKA